MHIVPRPRPRRRGTKKSAGLCDYSNGEMSTATARRPPMEGGARTCAESCSAVAARVRARCSDCSRSTTCPASPAPAPATATAPPPPLTPGSPSPPPADDDDNDDDDDGCVAEVSSSSARLRACSRASASATFCDIPDIWASARSPPSVATRRPSRRRRQQLSAEAPASPQPMSSANSCISTSPAASAEAPQRRPLLLPPLRQPTRLSGVTVWKARADGIGGWAAVSSTG
jgi:hypothetical protein